mmetsp:Transcript_296/g.869  ORF Transcript_296/g.869 Transcript_296/m.869 type:complete len:259 (+) Transcript_296:25-801(+)|eukprot:scaffold193574_cov31-Tisochrysis_lutea.AAC.5
MASEVAALPMENLTGELDTMEEAEFRSYVVRSKAAEEIIKVVVGLSESNARPQNPSKFLRSMFDTELELTDEPKEDFDAILEENRSLKQQIAELSGRVAEFRRKIPPGELTLSRITLLNVPERQGQDASCDGKFYARVELLSYASAGQPPASARTGTLAIAGEVMFEEYLRLPLPAMRDASLAPELRITLWDGEDTNEGSEPLASSTFALPDRNSGELVDVAMTSSVADGCLLHLTFEIGALSQQDDDSQERQAEEQG